MKRAARCSRAPLYFGRTVRPWGTSSLIVSHTDSTLLASMSRNWYAGKDIFRPQSFYSTTSSGHAERHHHHTDVVEAGPIARYDLLIKDKKIKDDPAQREALVLLQSLYERLIRGQSHPRQSHNHINDIGEDDDQHPTVESNPKQPEQEGGWFGSAFSKLFSEDESKQIKVEEKPREKKRGHVVRSPEQAEGVYFYGGVGCGKTFVMDLFHDSIPYAKKRRVHFNAFMLDVHSKIHQWRYKRRAMKEEMMEKGNRGGSTAAGDDSGDPLPPLAKDLAANATLLCFDEFQVTDVADAMLLHRLFSLMFSHGVTVVATSNRAPEELYKDGLQRDRFLPFIDLLYKRCIVHKFHSGLDYRLSGQRKLGIYHIQQNAEANAKLEEIFSKLTHPESPTSASLPVNGRRLFVPKVARGVAWFTFAELCKQALGAADYIALSQAYHTVILSDIPKMNQSHKSEARRFITLVDELYNHKVKVVCSAAAAPNDLFAGDEGHEEVQTNLYDELGHHLGSIWNGEEERFMFNRAVSRLIEMQSEEYLQAPHKPN